MWNALVVLLPTCAAAAGGVTKGPCVRGWCEPVLSGCACRVQRGQTYVVTFSLVTRRVLGCFVWLQRLFRPYFWEYKWGTNKRNGGVSSAESMLASIGNTTTVRLLFAAYCQAFSSNPMLLLTKSVPSNGTFSVWMCLPLCLKILISVAFSAETSVTVGTAAVD